MPDMKVVSEKSEKELAIQRASNEVGWRLRDLTANLLRVTRGAGRAHEIPHQALELLEAYERYYQVAGMYPDAGQFLSVYEHRSIASMNEDNFDLWDGKERVLKGALQIAASRLLGQRTQETAEDSDMFDGIRTIEKMWRRNRPVPQAPSRAPVKRARRPLKPKKG